MILVSRCLTGANCRYNGKSKPNKAIIDFLSTLQEGTDYLLICPESAGNLPIPRAPGEITGGNAAAVLRGEAKVTSKDGDDYTNAFLKGAADACQKASDFSANIAILKEKSPSCGVHLVHDGSFSGQTIPGCGVTTAALISRNITVFSENELKNLQNFLNQQKYK